ncbi:MAG: hypothetical protein LBT64_01450 [Puniceicoccales bacterium]|jgi:type II secretory pathway component GspD/PulD (secretin)|nr:hypothetical protein [Puniceicoccales bacterium]
MKVVKLFSMLTLLCLCGALCAAPNEKQTMSLPFSKASYYHFAKDQNLAELVHDFFAMQGITVLVSNNVKHTVNGRFNKMDPAEFWNYITKAYGLAWFFDGKIMFVYSNTELQTQIFRMDLDGIGTLSSILSRLGFLSSDFSFRSVGEANILIVTAPPQYITVISDIAAKFLPTKISDTTIVKIIPLKYAWAYDMTFNYANGSIAVPGVASLLQSIVTGQQLASALSPFNLNIGAGNSKNQMQQVPMAGIVDDSPQYAKDIRSDIKSLQNSGNASKNSSGDAKGSKSSGDRESEGKDTVDISGTTLPGFITCDQRLNAIIIRDRRENMPFYEEIIAKLDVPCEVIKIDVAIVNVNKTNTMSVGINNFALPNGSAKYIDAQGQQAGGSNLINGRRKFNLTSRVGEKDGNGNINLNLGVFKNMQIELYLDFLESSGSGQTISRPSVLTLDNVAAVLETDKIRYSTVQSQNAANAYSQSASTRMQVVPHIIPGEEDGMGKRKMKLFVDVVDGDFEATTSESQTGVSQHSLNTQAILYEDQSLLVGGYVTEDNKQNISGVPILKDLPIVGFLFKHSSDSKSVKERIYVISPSIVEIRSDDHKYDRFLQSGELTADPTLPPKEYPTTRKWPPDGPPRKRVSGRAH